VQSNSPSVPPAIVAGGAALAGVTAPADSRGFVDLIGLLLSAMSEPAPLPSEGSNGDAANGNAVGGQLTASPKASATVASPDQIAAALIRSMSSPVALPAHTQGPTPSLPQKGDETDKKKLKTADLVASLLSNGAITASVPLTPVPLPEAQKPAPGDVPRTLQAPGVSSEPAGQPAGAPADFTPSAVSSGSTAPLAFGMHLTDLMRHDLTKTQSPQTSASVAPAPVPLNPLETSEPERPGVTPAQAAASVTKEEAGKVLAVGAASEARADMGSQSGFLSTLHQAPPGTAKDPPQATSLQTEPGPSVSQVHASDVQAPLRPAVAQQISVRISPPHAPAVDLQLAQRGGQIQVAVRTPDAGLQVALRDDLGSLVENLERSGFHAETSVPVTAAAAAPSGSPSHSGSGQSNSHPDTSGNPGFGSPGGQGRGGSRESRTFEAWAERVEEQSSTKESS
jgi:hypothetical protein